jgi:uncharacterized membrane protein
MTYGQERKNAACRNRIVLSSQIDRLLKYSHAKVIMPVVTLGLLRSFLQNGQTVFSDAQIKKAYEAAVKSVKEFLGHDVLGLIQLFQSCWMFLGRFPA